MKIKQISKEKSCIDVFFYFPLKQLIMQHRLASKLLSEFHIPLPPFSRARIASM